jgi:hypothetical protein
MEPPWSRKRVGPAAVSPGHALNASPDTRQPVKLRRGSPHIQWVGNHGTPLHFGSNARWNEAAPSKERPRSLRPPKENCAPPWREPESPCRYALTPPVPRTPNLTPHALNFASDSSRKNRSRLSVLSPSAEASGDGSSLDSIQEAIGVLQLPRDESCSPEVSAVRPNPGPRWLARSPLCATSPAFASASPLVRSSPVARSPMEPPRIRGWAAPLAPAPPVPSCWTPRPPVPLWSDALPSPSVPALWCAPGGYPNLGL